MVSGQQAKRWPYDAVAAALAFDHGRKVIEETLASFNVQARVVEVSSGPTVTQFGLEPA